ncbi:hypothetical protein BU17DRAFT_93456 [Hysterangium stoloniferum]|nr:hypothetical protein BU17DRAFT_93456 [Hysterangium stoloniferum]
MAKDVSRKKHRFAKSTNIKYNQRLREARTWLKELVETEQSPTIPLEVDELDSFDWMLGELEGTLMEGGLAPGDGITRKKLVVAIQPILKKLNAQLMPSNAKAFLCIGSPDFLFPKKEFGTFPKLILAMGASYVQAAVDVSRVSNRGAQKFNYIVVDDGEELVSYGDAAACRYQMNSAYDHAAGGTWRTPCAIT